MGIKKIIPMLIVLLFIFPAKTLYPQGATEGTDVNTNTVKNYVEKFDVLSKQHDDAKFNEIFKTFQDFKDIIAKGNKALENGWIGEGDNSKELGKGYAADLGKSLAKIIEDNLDNPERIKLVGGYIEKLGETLLNNNYKTAAWKVYVNISGELKSSTDLTQAMENLNKEFTPIEYGKIGEAADKLTGLAKSLMEKSSIFPLLNDIENLKKQKNSLEERIKKLEERDRVTSAWGRVKKFIEAHVAWFIIGLMLILFIAISIFLFFHVYIRRQLQVKIPHSLDSNETNGEKIRPINDEVQRLSSDIADLKKLKEKYIKPVTEKEGIGEEAEETKFDYESFSESIKKDFDTKLEDLKSNLKLASYEKIGEQLSGIFEQMGNLMKKSGDPKQVENIILTTERQILLGIWNLESFKEGKTELYRIAEKMKEKQVLFEKCLDLANQIGFHKELSPYYETILRPMRNYQHKLTQFLDVQNVLGKAAYPEPSKNIFEIKQKIYFLVILQHLNQVPELLKFSLEKWFNEEFLDFADQFLRKYQSDEFHRTLSEEMETAKDKILDILSFFDIEPIPIVLGQTAFNSQVHMGQSNVRDSSMIDGAIAEVIKNGFKEKQGGVRIRPEVIVNRL